MIVNKIVDNKEFDSEAKNVIENIVKKVEELVEKSNRSKTDFLANPNCRE